MLHHVCDVTYDENMCGGAGGAWGGGFSGEEAIMQLRHLLHKIGWQYILLHPKISQN